MKKFKRILLKLSGESLMGEKEFGIDHNKLMQYVQDIKSARTLDVEIGIVIGGGNIFRGLRGNQEGFDRISGDQMGMLATVINSLALVSSLKQIGIKAKLLTAIGMEPIGELYTTQRAIDYIERGYVVVIAGGTGNPFFTTDTGAALRAVEIDAKVMLKGTRVDGIYNDDPEKNKDAEKFDSITYSEIYRRNLKVMDLTATTLCMENSLPIIVFDMDTPGNLLKVLLGEKIGTFVGRKK